MVTQNSTKRKLTGGNSPHLLILPFHQLADKDKGGAWLKPDGLAQIGKSEGFKQPPSPLY